MKNFILLVLFIALPLGLIACTEKNKGESIAQDDVRQVVWNQLKTEDQERIDGTWKDAMVSKITLREDMMSLVEDKSYAGKEVYLINFPTMDNFEPNNMVVYADLENYDFIGYGLVE